MNSMIITSLASFSNMITIGILIKSCPQCTYLISLAQFIAIFIIQCILLFANGLHRPKVPLKQYFKIALLYFLHQVLSFRCLSYKVSIPLQSVLKSSNLLLNIFIGKLFLGRHYCQNKYLAAFLVTIGTISITINDQSFQNDSSSHQMIFGLFLLFSSIVISTILQLIQEQTFIKYGKHVGECVFYTNIMSLVPSLFLFTDIIDEFTLASTVPDIEVKLLHQFSFFISFWVILMIRVIGGYFFTRANSNLISTNGSLTMMLFGTVRRFVNLILGMYFSGTTFYPFQWISTCLVFIGVLIYSDKIWPFKKKE